MNGAKHDAKHIKCENNLQCLMQGISNAKEECNVWCKTYQMRNNNTLFGAKHIKCEAIIQCLMQNKANAKQNTNGNAKEHGKNNPPVIIH